MSCCLALTHEPTLSLGLPSVPAQFWAQSPSPSFCLSLAEGECKPASSSPSSPATRVETASVRSRHARPEVRDAWEGSEAASVFPISLPLALPSALTSSVLPPSEVSKKHSHPTNSLGVSWDSFQSLLQKPRQHGLEALIHPEQPVPRGPAESEDGPRRGQPRLLVPGKGDGGKGTWQSGFRPWRHNPSNSNNSCHIKSQVGFKSHLLPVREPLSTSEVPCREVYSKFTVTQLISSRTRSRVRVYSLSLGLSSLVLKQTKR